MPDIARDAAGAPADAPAVADTVTDDPVTDAVTHDDPEEVPAPDDLDLEAPEADVAEQRTEVLDEHEKVWEPVPDGVDPADGQDQRRVAGPDEDGYR